MKETEPNIILDSDTGEDDALAILVAVKNKLPIHYVISSHGNSTIENTTRNASRLLSYVDEPNVQVIKGSSKPLEQHIHKKEGEIETAGSFVGNNGLCNVELPESKFQNVIDPGEEKLPEFLASVIKAEAPVDYIITGPSTNFAKVNQFLGSDIKKYVRNVYIMGGAIHESGNSGPINPQTGKGFAEFNFYCDPNAVNVVLESGLPVHLITWDITSQLTVPYARIEQFATETAMAKFVAKLMKNFFETYGLSHDRNFELNDPVTVMAKMGYGSYRVERIQVLTSGLEYGQSVVDPNGHSVRYFTLDADQKRDIIEAVLHTLDVIK